MECKNNKCLLFVILFFTLTFSSLTYANDSRVIVFILDGAPRDLLYGMIENDSLPTLKKYFWDDGIHSKATITTFPSASAPAYQSFITGLFAGHSGIPYLQRYNRLEQKKIDYLGSAYKRVNDDLQNFYAVGNANNGPITIFEGLKGDYTVSIYSEISRGAMVIRPKHLFGPLSDVFLSHREENLDMRAMREVKKIFSGSEIPKFTLVGLYSTDVLQHKQGIASQDAKDALRQFDLAMDEFIKLIQRRGVFDSTYIVVTSDHGMHNIDHKISLKLDKKDVFISERGVASAHLYFLKNDDVKKATISSLRGNSNLSLIIEKGDGGSIEVYSKECHSTISKKDIGGHFYYGYEAHECDPLSYCNEPVIKKMCDGGFYDSRKWLETTFDKSYPDGVVQLGQIFDDGRAGDVFIVSDRSGFYRNKKATHGSLMKDDMVVPLLMRGPGIKHGEFGPVRTVDLYPMMLEWLELPINEMRDGVLDAKFTIRQK